MKVLLEELISVHLRLPRLGCLRLGFLQEVGRLALEGGRELTAVTEGGAGASVAGLWSRELEERGS